MERNDGANRVGEACTYTHTNNALSNVAQWSGENCRGIMLLEHFDEALTRVIEQRLIYS